jgi:hypothetical protein
MAETLVELVAKISADATELKKGLADAEKDVAGTGKSLEKETKSWQDQFKAVGKLAVGMGASITAAMGLAINSFANTGDELIHMSEKTGISVQSLSELKFAAGVADVSLSDLQIAFRGMSNIMETARNGGDAAIATFSKLGLKFEDLKGLNPEQLFMTLASSIGSVSDPVQRAALAVDLFGRSGTNLIPMFADGAEGIAKLRQKAIDLGVTMGDDTAKSGHALSIALTTIKESAGGVFNAIGSQLAPTLTDLADKITGLVSGFTKWAKEHPELVKQIGLLTLAVGGFLTLAGTLMMLAPAIAAAWGVAMGPVGWITLAIAGLITAGILLWQNWDKVSHFFADVWSNMKTAVLNNVDAMLGYLEKFLGWVPGIGDKIRSARDAISNMIDAEKVGRDAADVARSAQAMTGTIKSELEKQKADVLAGYAIQRTAAKSLYDKNIADINKEYGIAESTTRNKIQDAQELSSFVQKGYQRDMKAARDKADSDIRELNRVYNATIKNLDIATNATVKGLQDQIDAIDNKTEQEDLALTRAAEQKRIKELEAGDDEVALKEYLTEVARNELLRQRDAEKDALRDKITTAQDEAQNEKDRLQTSLDANILNQETIRDSAIANLELLSIEEDKALVKKLADIETDRLAAIKAQDEILTTTITNITTAETAIKASFDARLTEAAIYQSALEAALPDIEQTVTTHYVSDSSGGGGMGALSPSEQAAADAGQLQTFATGGIVPGAGPQLAIVHGGETIIPAGESGGVTVNISGPLFMEREDQMNQLVDKIRKGIQRSDRLRFGGAYSG